MNEYRALICVTTCLRPERLRRHLPHLAAFTAEDSRFHLLVALDGTEEEYLSFCREWEVALIHSEEREGVGISKNRVLERHPDYDYYFFLDDDVELVDGSVFPAHVRLARASGIHHFSLFAEGGVRKATGESTLAGMRVVHGLFGGGQFSFFTGAGLETVGGWHPRFAKWRRWGHTEHSYRFWRAGLAPAPFNVAEELASMCIWHYPPSVSPPDLLPRDEDQIVAPERALIEEALVHYPVTTLSPHFSNGIPPGGTRRLATVLGSGERYPLVSGSERRRSRSHYHLWRARQATGAGGRARALLRAFLDWPGNPRLRHALKRWLSAT